MFSEADGDAFVTLNIADLVAKTVKIHVYTTASPVCSTSTPLQYPVTGGYPVEQIRQTAYRHLKTRRVMSNYIYVMDRAELSLVAQGQE